ncbi:hypothetical protein BIV57_21200 [Mangrovactinospora gilvigrisea]|uniref:Uncharacterized protein n=1 Tax=Mangrovactinospora gilvigrisea TaxID=1428644 RepID=A0A1J7BA34_9ACTN|nr:hypothetical protein BIV57_21200 [Mangrovactinospora gilvigrisea]
MAAGAAAADGAEHAVHRPGTVLGAAAVAGVQAVALAVWGLYIMAAPLFASGGDLVRAEAGGVVLLLCALLPGIAVRGLWQLKRWGRGPAATLNLCCLPVGYTVWQQGGSLVWVGILVMATAIAGLVCLVHPRTSAALDVHRRA